jgi:hypothetical protein
MQKHLKVLKITLKNSSSDESGSGLSTDEDDAERRNFEMIALENLNLKKRRSGLVSFLWKLMI